MNEITAAVTALKKQLGARVRIMGHHYQSDAVVAHCDITGDSLELARLVPDVDAEHIVFCGVFFMGESAALLFTAGFAHTLNGFFDGLRNSGATLTVSLYVYAKEQGEFGVAFAIAAILIAITVLINLSASLVSRCFKKRRQI